MMKLNSIKFALSGSIIITLNYFLFYLILYYKKKYLINHITNVFHIQIFQLLERYVNIIPKNVAVGAFYVFVYSFISIFLWAYLYNKFIDIADKIYNKNK